MDDQIYAILDALTKDLELAHEEIATLKKQMADEHENVMEHVKNLEETVFDVIIGSCKDAMEEEEYFKRLDEFKSRYGSQFEPYRDDVKFIERKEDFDLDRAAMDGYEALPEEGRMPEEEFVADFVEHIAKQVQEFKERFGVAPDAKVSVEEKDGNAELKVDEQTVADNGGEVVEENSEVETEEEMDSPEEIAELEKELAKELSR